MLEILLPTGRQSVTIVPSLTALLPKKVMHERNVSYADKSMGKSALSIYSEKLIYLELLVDHRCFLVTLSHCVNGPDAFRTSAKSMSRVVSPLISAHDSAGFSLVNRCYARCAGLRFVLSFVVMSLLFLAPAVCHANLIIFAAGPQGLIPDELDDSIWQDFGSGDSSSSVPDDSPEPLAPEQQKARHVVPGRGVTDCDGTSEPIPSGGSAAPAGLATENSGYIVIGISSTISGFDDPALDSPPPIELLDPPKAAVSHVE